MPGNRGQLIVNDEIKKPSFLVYYDNEVVVVRLSDEEAGRLFKSLFPYGREEIKPDFEESPALAMAFDILGMAIDRDKEKYVKRCEKNRKNIEKRWAKSGKQSNTNVCVGKQSNTKRTDKDMDMDKDKDMDMGRDSNINYQQIADMYNETCVSFPRITKLSDSRKKAIKARLNQYAIEDFRKLFQMAEESSFLKGQNSRDWIPNFDWLVKDANMAKVLDGNYTDRRTAQGETGEGGREQYRSYEEFEKELRESLGKKGTVQGEGGACGKETV